MQRNGLLWERVRGKARAARMLCAEQGVEPREVEALQAIVDAVGVVLVDPSFRVLWGLADALERGAIARTLSWAWRPVIAAIRDAGDLVHRESVKGAQLWGTN